MKVIKKKLTELHRPERNARIHSSKQLAEFKRSIEMFGQIRPIVIDEAGTILAGNGLYEALCAMERTDADCYIAAGLTESQKKKLMLADNRIFSLGVDDLETFDAFLDDLKGDLDIPGFDEEMLESMVAQAGEVTEKLQEYGTLDENEIEEIKAARKRKDLYMTTGLADEGGADEPEGDILAQEKPKEPVRQYVACPHCGEKIWL